MKFVEESTLPQDAQLRKEDQPLNIGVRIKKLKSTENTPIPEEPTETIDKVDAVEPVEEIQTADPISENKIRQGQEIHPTGF